MDVNTVKKQEVNNQNIEGVFYISVIEVYYKDLRLLKKLSKDSEKAVIVKDYLVI